MATAKKITTKKVVTKKPSLHDRLLTAKFSITGLKYSEYINRKVWKYGSKGYAQYPPSEIEKKQNRARFIDQLFQTLAMKHTCSMYEIGYANKYFIQHNSQLFIDMVRESMKSSPRRKIYIMNIRFTFKTKDPGVRYIGSYIGNHNDSVHTYIINKTKTKFK